MKGGTRTLVMHDVSGLRTATSTGSPSTSSFFPRSRVPFLPYFRTVTAVPCADRRTFQTNTKDMELKRMLNSLFFLDKTNV